MRCEHRNILSATQQRKETEMTIDKPQSMKYVQTAFSSLDIGPIKCKLNQRSYSEEEIGDDSRRYNRKELKEEILEWIDVYNDKLKVKLLRDKMQKLAQKLNKPGEEEKLRKKIDKYLKSIPNQPDCDDRAEFTGELADNLISKLRKVYLSSERGNVNRTESLKFDSNVKRAVMNWLVTIPIKRQAFLGKTFRRDDILHSLTDIIKSVIIDRPHSDEEYKRLLTSSIANVVESLPTDDCNKNRKLADDLATDILNISSTLPDRHVQPTVRELKQFISDEIIYFVEESLIIMNTKSLKYLEAELIDAFVGINDIDEIVSHKVCYLFQDIGKIPACEARYLTNIIVNDYKDNFFRDDNSREETSNVYYEQQNETNVQMNNDKSLVNRLIDEIYAWFREQPIDLDMTKENLAKHSVRDLAEKITSGLSMGDIDIIDNEVNLWTEKIFKGNLRRNNMKRLKSRLENVRHREIEVERDPKNEKLVIRRYEDIIDEWVDKSIDAIRQDSPFFDIRNERIHDLAVKLYNVKLRFNECNEIIYKKLQEEVLDWMATLPFDKQRTTVISAANLVENIQACNTVDEDTTNCDNRQLEDAVIDWLKKLPLYKNKSAKNKEIMELIMTKLAVKLCNSIKDSNLDPNTEIMEYIRMLDPNQNDEFVYNTAVNLEQYLQKLNIIENVFKRIDPYDEFLVANINIWLKYLPFDAKAVIDLESRKKKFVDVIKRLRFWGAGDDILKEEIIVFLAGLPLIKRSKQFIHEEATKLIQSLSIIVGDVPNKLTYTNNEITNIVRDWCKKLPLITNYSFRELQYLIDNIIKQIINLQAQPRHDFNDGHLQEEIIKNLKCFPLKLAYNSDDIISQIANDLIEMLKDRIQHLNNNITVYGVSLEKDTITDTDYSIKSIKDDDIKSNIDNYAKQLVGHINKWLHNLNVPNIKEQNFKEVVINDLAGDIIDRHKYLELNPKSVGSNEEELEHLKYQIFKWINKLVGEDNLVTIEHAGDLMKRIQSVPVPMLVKPLEKILLTPTDSIQSSSLKPSQNTNVEPNKLQSDTRAPEKSLGNFKGKFENSRKTSEGALGLATATNSPSKSSHNTILRQAASNPGGQSFNTAPQDQVNTLPKIYDKYQKLFIEKSNEIVNAAIPNDKSLADMAKVGIYKGILNGFFTLKSNSDVENDYACFEFMLEDKIDELIDLLPRTTELDKIKHSWKISVLINAVDMLKEIHNVTDRPTFRQQLTRRLNRKALKDLEDKECFGLQQAFLVEMANDYILKTKYIQDDPIKSNIYKQRLMKKLDDFTNHITREHKLGFKYINRAALRRLAIKVLDEVPIPANDVLQEEVEEILLAEEIQHWYQELPTYPYLNDMDVLLRKRLIDILARKLNEIDKNVSRENPSKERLMKHEMTMFLERKGKLQPNQDLNINFMVDELNNRLKNRWIDKSVEYESFHKDKPISSTLAWYENDILQPVNAARGSNAAYTQSYEMPNDYGPYSYVDNENVQNSQPRYAYAPNITRGLQNPNEIDQIDQGCCFSNVAKDDMNVYKVNSGYQGYNKHQDGDRRTCYMESNQPKGYAAKMRTEIESGEEEDGKRVRCQCYMRRSYVCYDCDDDCRRFVPCQCYY